MNHDEQIARLKAAYEAGEIDGAEADRLIRALAAERAQACAAVPAAGDRLIGIVRGLLDDPRALRALRAFCDAYLSEGT